MGDFKLKTHDDFKDIRVYWAAQQVSFSMLGNHHFMFFLSLSSGPKFNTGAIVSKVGSYKFFTLSVNTTPGREMMLNANDVDDQRAVKNWLQGKNPNRFQLNEVPSPSGSGVIFANKLLRLARVYNKNVKKYQLKYHLTDLNCASAVNSIFKAAGVSKKNSSQMW